MTNERELLKLCADFLQRFASSPNFAREFDKDPAAALRKHYPQLRKVPKEKTAEVLNEHTKAVNELIRASTQPALALSGASVICVCTCDCSSSMVAFRSLVRAVATALVSYLLFSAVEPVPE